MKAVADTLGVSRSNLVERLKGRSKPRGAYHKAEDAELLPIIRRLEKHTARSRRPHP
ncbi:hypothetical protein DSM25559_5030 [Agrobacterium rosae]|jgi:hypothetical protein|uniref:Uncharacterized protein n=1 Tax=Agrobacterium rosae TaxID=1972867 RepID=A0A1R3U5S9_9HYPH|nr:hypothetical protein DSM25559_5030 [Agrobacterium rosae]